MNIKSSYLPVLPKGAIIPMKKLFFYLILILAFSSRAAKTCSLGRYSPGKANGILQWTLPVGWIRPDADAPAAHVPGCLIEGGYLYLYYATQKGHTLGAVEYDYRYNRVRVMRIALETLAEIGKDI